jgi:hypothetical protein
MCRQKYLNQEDLCIRNKENQDELQLSTIQWCLKSWGAVQFKRDLPYQGKRRRTGGNLHSSHRDGTSQRQGHGELLPPTDLGLLLPQPDLGLLLLPPPDHGQLGRRLRGDPIPRQAMGEDGAGKTGGVVWTCGGVSCGWGGGAAAARARQSWCPECLAATAGNGVRASWRRLALLRA